MNMKALMKGFDVTMQERTVRIYDVWAKDDRIIFKVIDADGRQHRAIMMTENGVDYHLIKVVKADGTGV